MTDALLYFLSPFNSPVHRQAVGLRAYHYPCTIFCCILNCLWLDRLVDCSMWCVSTHRPTILEASECFFQVLLSILSSLLYYAIYSNVLSFKCYFMDYVCLEVPWQSRNKLLWAEVELRRWYWLSRLLAAGAGWVLYQAHTTNSEGPLVNLHWLECIMLVLALDFDSKAEAVFPISIRGVICESSLVLGSISEDPCSISTFSLVPFANKLCMFQVSVRKRENHSTFQP